MSEVLSKIESIKDLKKLNIEEKKKIAQELRGKILEIVSKNGGHLASNLGVVELTIALHSVFSVPEDQIVWDVGHQTYSHKILTGRKEKMDTLRKMGGIAGFPKVSEAEEDCFNTGHSSTSISVALGMARARDLQEKDAYVIALLGDGALTGGMALEALNDAGASNTNLIVILNDNEMSISKNVGGISRLLTRARTRKWYQKSNQSIKRMIHKLPYLGDKIIQGVGKVKRGIKQLAIPNMIFEDMGFTYLGPVDGHNIEKLEQVLQDCKTLKGPILVHVITKKGKGYEIAEKNPDRYHSTSAFDIKTGKALSEKKKDYSAVFGEKLVELAEKNKKIVAVTAAMKDGTGLGVFAKRFPERFFDVGIAEQHTIGMAAGMAKAGMIPVVPIYASFYQRAYDQVIHDVCMQNLPVVLCVDRAGIVGNDGETHQGILNLSFFRIIPNLTIMAPKDFQELEQMLEFAIKLEKPVVLLYPRGTEGNFSFESHEEIKLGKSENIQKIEDAEETIIAIGKMVTKAMQIAKKKELEGIKVNIVNARFLKPLDQETILQSIQGVKKVIIIEDNIKIGGLGTAIQELIVQNRVKEIEVECIGYPDEYIPHGSVQELEKEYLGIE